MKILIVEDSELYSKLLKKNIDKYLVFAECEVVKSFAELKDLSSYFDLYLCDYILPDAPNGEHIGYLINKNQDVIVLTQYEKEFLNTPYKEKIIDYIVKDDFHTIEYLIRFIKRLYKNKNLNVLVVDDSSTMRKYLKRFLQKIAFNVYEANNGQEALNIVEKEDIDLVITDLNMPLMDGEELLINLREKFSMSDLPVIILSSNNQNQKFIKTLKLGANDFLQKPFMKEELILRVNNLLEIYENMKSIKKQAQIDPLTGAYNRMFLENLLESVFKVNQAKTIAMLDIDFFKQINDGYGHQTGDEVLKHFVRIIKETVRKTDFVIRYGGEEFLIYMPDTSKEEAMIVLYKIKKNLTPANGIEFTFSAGIADEGETLSEMIKIADERLYSAKRSGRNKIVIK
jgi:diguanylate cyclase (GGDEF)-like protein